MCWWLLCLLSLRGCGDDWASNAARFKWDWKLGGKRWLWVFRIGGTVCAFLSFAQAAWWSCFAFVWITCSGCWGVWVPWHCFWWRGRFCAPYGVSQGWMLEGVGSFQGALPCLLLAGWAALLELCQSLVRSGLDYGCILCDSAWGSCLWVLGPVQGRGLEAVGSFGIGVSPLLESASIGAQSIKGAFCVECSGLVCEATWYALD